MTTIKLFHCIVFMLYFSIVKGQLIDLNNINFTENAIYLVCRSSKQKISFIAKDFNLLDSLITHIGIGIFENNELVVYNVSNFKKNKKESSLIKESYDEFISLDDIVYVSIWKKEIKNNKKRIIETINFYENLIIDFDFSFDLKTNKQLYCSEFVYKVFKDARILEKTYNPTKKKLEGMYAINLGGTFKYIPVDFFITDKTIEKIYEHYN